MQRHEPVRPSVSAAMISLPSRAMSGRLRRVVYWNSRRPRSRPDHRISCRLEPFLRSPAAHRAVHGHGGSGAVGERVPDARVYPRTDEEPIPCGPTTL